MGIKKSNPGSGLYALFETNRKSQLAKLKYILVTQTLTSKLVPRVAGRLRELQAGRQLHKIHHRVSASEGQVSGFNEPLSARGDPTCRSRSSCTKPGLQNLNYSTSDRGESRRRGEGRYVRQNHGVATTLNQGMYGQYTPPPQPPAQRY